MRDKHIWEYSLRIFSLQGIPVPDAGTKMQKCLVRKGLQNFLKIRILQDFLFKGWYSNFLTIGRQTTHIKDANNYKPNQTKPNLTKPNQNLTKPNQTKPNQTKPHTLKMLTTTKTTKPNQT